MSRVGPRIPPHPLPLLLLRELRLRPLREHFASTRRLDSSPRPLLHCLVARAQRQLLLSVDLLRRVISATLGSSGPHRRRRLVCLRHLVRPARNRERQRPLAAQPELEERQNRVTSL
jgi:hypothetical protein